MATIAMTNQRATRNTLSGKPNRFSKIVEKVHELSDLLAGKGCVDEDFILAIAKDLALLGDLDRQKLSINIRIAMQRFQALAQEAWPFELKTIPEVQRKTVITKEKPVLTTRCTTPPAPSNKPERKVPVQTEEQAKLGIVPRLPPPNRPVRVADAFSLDYSWKPDPQEGTGVRRIQGRQY